MERTVDAHQRMPGLATEERPSVVHARIRMSRGVEKRGGRYQAKKSGVNSPSKKSAAQSGERGRPPNGAQLDGEPSS